MDSTVERIANEAIVELPGCPRPMVYMAIRDALRDFLDRSHILKVDLDAINIVASTYLYTLTLPTGYDGFRVGRPTLVVLNGVEQRAGIDYRMQSRTVLQLRETPQAAITDGLEVTVTAALDDIETVDLTDIDDWLTTITAGVKGRLMLMPGKPWTAQQTATMYRAEWSAGLSRAMSAAALDGLTAPARVSM